MALVTITEAKAQCRVTNNLEDDLITLYMNAADDWIANYLNVQDIPQKSAIKAAALLIIHDLWDKRSATTVEKTYKNPAVDALLYPYRQDIGI